jgi:hypothetical protein
VKQFLRFQISGITCLFWSLLFFIPYIDWAKLSTVEAEKLIVALIGSIALSLPLGSIIHQISISLLSPFRKKRLFIPRTVIEELKLIGKNHEFVNKDPKFQNILVFAKGTKLSWTDAVTHVSKEIDIEYIRQEIDNRYSYYYVRMDNGFFAPLFAYGIFYLFKSVLHKAGANIFIQSPLICIYTIPTIAIFVCALMLFYIPVLFKEIDDIERYLVCYENYIDAKDKDSADKE